MLFRNEFKERIRGGEVTMTFRTWKTARAIAGRTYRLGPEDAAQVTAVDRVPIGEITQAQARRAGFQNVASLVEELRRVAKRRLTSRSKVFRIRFRHVEEPDPRAARRKSTSASALDAVAKRLARMDRLSRRGPWTVAALRQIAERPRTPARELAPETGRELRAYKADIRKLKQLGLTVSHRVGYSLSPRGKALLKRLAAAGG